jgi:hypothetical protein
MAKATPENRTMIKGYCSMSKKWNNMGIARSKIGGKKTEIPNRSTKHKLRG